jgi:hypothetical protein
MHSLHLSCTHLWHLHVAMLLERRDYVASLVENNRSHQADSRRLWGASNDKHSLIQHPLSPRGSAKDTPTNDIEWVHDFPGCGPLQPCTLAQSVAEIGYGPNAV